jgi:Ni/Fe-hydrogenase 1 B-type cytochrome subunit
MTTPTPHVKGPKFHLPVGIHLRSQISAPTGDYRWVYIWGWPLRFVHWTSSLTIVLLALTGMYIGKPYFLVAGEASSHFVMGWFRLIHFTAAGVLVAGTILRLYWFIMGNRYERFGALFPVSRKRLVDIWRTFRSYALIRPQDAPKYLGHNPLQQVAVSLLYLGLLVMIVTGFAMYSQATPGGVLSRAFAWVAPLFGGMPVVRFVHHIITWLIACFVPLHIYLAIRHELLDHGAVVSSIISGGRFVSVHERFEDA